MSLRVFYMPINCGNFIAIIFMDLDRAVIEEIEPALSFVLIACLLRGTVLSVQLSGDIPTGDQYVTHFWSVRQEHGYRHRRASGDRRLRFSPSDDPPSPMSPPDFTHTNISILPVVIDL